MEQGEQDILEDVFSPRKSEGWSGGDMRFSHLGSAVDLNMCSSGWVQYVHVQLWVSWCECAPFR